MAKFYLLAYFLHAALIIQPGEISDASARTTHLIEELRQELIAERFGSLFTEFAQKNGFNGTVLLSHDGQIVYKNAFGYANLKLKTPLAVESVFQLASVSKQFTALAVMMLHDRGLLDFNDPIQKYFPDLPYATVTIRQMLEHRSGIPDYMNFAGRYWRHRSDWLNNDDVLALLAQHHLKLEFTPGSRYRYSNTNYAIMASLIEKLSGSKYADFMREQVFLPLGMRSTFVFDPNNRMALEYQTTGYNKNLRPANEDFLSGVVGDKGIYSTVDDMYKWDQGLYTEKLVRQSTLDEAFSPTPDGPRYDNNYGYGWRIMRSERGEKILYHAGWWRGYNSLDVRRPGDKTFICVLSNKVNWCFRDIDHLLDVVDASEHGSMAMR